MALLLVRADELVRMVREVKSVDCRNKEEEVVGRERSIVARPKTDSLLLTVTLRHRQEKQGLISSAAHLLLLQEKMLLHLTQNYTQPRKWLSGRMIS